MSTEKRASPWTALTPDENKLLSLLLEEEGIEREREEVIPRRERDGAPPLSFAQQRLWFLDQLQSGISAYNIPVAVRLSGELNVAALEQSLSEIIARHETLRTTFATVDSQPVQIVSPPGPFTLSVFDLCELRSPAQEEEVQQLAQQEATCAFDLEAGPLLRAQLLQLSEGEQVLLLTMHHIVSDGWSMGVLVRELCALYEAFSQGGESGLAPLAVQYADYAQWQRERLVGEVLEQQLQYWREQLAGAPALLELPADRARPAVQSFRGARESVRLGAELTRALKELSRAEGVTLFMTLLAGFAVLLWRYTGQRDVVVGTPVANRGRREVEGLIGFFVNTLSLRLQLAGEESFAETLRRVREVCLGGYAHQEVPFERVVEELGVERRLSQSPLFQVMFALQNAPQMRVELPNLEIKTFGAETGSAKFDLLLLVTEGTDELVATMEYSTDLFERETVERWAGHYQRLLTWLVRHPERPLWEAELLSAEERRQQLEEWNATAAEFAGPALVHELFEQQVRRTPEAVALVYEHETLCYAELNARANQLAHYLRRHGVGPESLVGIVMERSLELLVAVLGTLKAGAAYVPLDPGYPAERLAYMISDAGASVVLTQERLSGVLPGVLAEQRAKVICVDRDWAEIARESAADQGSGAGPDNLAYVIYTSGSTGRPKGVQVTHENVSRLFAATHQWFEFNAQDVWTLFHSFAFDFSVWEIWGALLFGGRLVIVPYWLSRSPDEFYAMLGREGVTVLNQTPSAFRQLLQAEERMLEAGSGVVAELALRFVIFGGEALDTAGLSGWLGRHGEEQPQLINMYGITETTVHVTYRPIRLADAVRVGAGSVIGRGIPDLQVYVLDEFQQLAPVGVTGELYVGGEGVARGYLQRPELTAERFVPDGLSGRPGGRLYRSGDLARYRAHGDLEYMGRGDQQVKVRGFRIELGEIEAVLNGFAGVKQCVVMAPAEAEDAGGQSGEKRLVAYVVTDREQPVTVNELRHYLKDRLPEYMVPTAIVMLEELPKLPNGKVNRRNLPIPDTVRPELAQTFMPARSSIEEVLSGIWTQVLGIEQVGINDNFFDLGGDSIRSVRVLALAKQRGLNLTLQQLFQHQTIENLARHLQTDKIAAELPHRSKPFDLVSEADRLQMPADIEDAYPLTRMQAGMLYHMDLTPDTPVYHNIDSFHLRSPLNVEALQRTIEMSVERHAVLRTSFHLTTYSQSLQLVHKEATMQFHVEDLRNLSYDEQEKVLDAFVKRQKIFRFDITKPPLLALNIHMRTDETLQFTITECHAIFDGWSLQSTLTEIFKNYRALLNNQTPVLEPPPAVTFRDFVQLEQMALASEECQEFWERKLSDCSPLRLPLKNSREPSNKTLVRALQLPIDGDVLDGLKRLARSTAVSLKHVLLAAHVKVLSMLSGQTDILTGLSTNGRPEELDGEIVRGLFLNTVPFSVKLSDNSWAELVQDVFKVELELLPFRRYPLAELQRKWGREQLLETAFNYVNFHVLGEILTSDVISLDYGHRLLEETNFTLLASFHVHPLTEQVHLRLSCDTTKINDSQMEAAKDYYDQTLRQMAAEPHSLHMTLNALRLLSTEERTLLEKPTDIAELKESFSF